MSGDSKYISGQDIVTALDMCKLSAKMEHILVFRGSYIEQALLSAIWAELHASPVVDIRAVYKTWGTPRYLAKAVANRY
jgi:hypothetical protein